MERSPLGDVSEEAICVTDLARTPSRREGMSNGAEVAAEREGMFTVL